MPQLYKILTFVLAFTGCSSLIISGEVNPLMYITGIGLFPGYYRFLKNMPQAPKWAIGSISILTILIFFADSFIISRDYFIAVAHLTVTFQAIKSFDLREPWDHLQVYFMSLLQLIVASELTHSIAFGVIFVLFLTALVSAIVLAHFIKEGTTVRISIKKPVIYISFLTLLITILFFVSTPRLSGGLWGKGYKKSIKTVGFSQKVDFGSFGDVKSDPTIVMRVELNRNISQPYYWRGMALNQFDGVAWKDILESREWIYKKEGLFTVKPFRKEEAVMQKIFLEPMDTDVVFGLSDIVAVEAEVSMLVTDIPDALSLPAKKGKRFHYVVYSILDLPEAKGHMKQYLQLPFHTERISGLAHGIISPNDKDLDKAKKIARFLRNNYTYSLYLLPPPEGVSQIEDFLFNSKKGYCEHYATAMILMLRTVGVPARIVTGFIGGELNEYGGYIIVRQSNAHSWVEAVIEGRWMMFDPTPAVAVERPSSVTLFIDMLRMKWDRYIVAFSFSDQKELIKVFSSPFHLPSMPDFRLRGISRVIYILIPVCAIFIIIFLSGKIRIRRYAFVTAQYMRLKQMVKKKGIKITQSTTPSDVKREAMRLGTDVKVEEFIRLYQEYRFGGREMGGEDRARYQSLIKEIKRQIKS